MEKLYSKRRYYEKGDGIRVKISGDVDVTGKQKYRPGIIIKVYPNGVKVQLFSTDSTNNYFSITINDQIQYVKAKYNISILFNQINQRWISKNNNKPIKIKDDNFFKQIAEMEVKEITELNFSFLKYKNLQQKIHKLECKVQSLRQENKELKEKLLKEKNARNRNKR